MNLTTLEKKTAQAVICVFETSKPRGDYGKVTTIAGDTGGLTYGKSQTTLTTGFLHELIAEYCAAPGAAYAEPLRGFLPYLKKKDRSIAVPVALKTFLRSAGADPVMQAVQDAFFDRKYWQPALTWCRDHGMTLPLSIAVVYDGFVHGSFERMRNRFKEVPPSAGGNEKLWVIAYLTARLSWLENFRSRPDLQKTVYRPKTFLRLIHSGNWKLIPPFAVNGTSITAENV